ncbi:protein asteroid [Anopheles ziemanni]|uniref:protein asteroid n=1 Tax=Anopheles coustani TaxID=139045 RepID=UPI00265A3D3F|nr:protein asteroid [Anopheles coustani]XP_058170624.1 protein asteroid [Anopheles ziemanni]
MGVRGLTTFIASKAEIFLKPYELHDTNLVIDGDNLCIQLFKKSQLTSTPLGGNYDLYHRIVLDFFHILSMCNVVPYVLLDGGYEARKMYTVKDRLLQSTRFMKTMNHGAITSTKPLMLREVFVDALRCAGVSFMRCPFEADDEVAILARKLNCPVMSYDSDFYIHNVQYIPYVTMTHKVYRKVTDKEGENFEIGIVEWNRSKSSAKKMERVKFVAQYGDESVINSDAAETYYYLDCCMYTIDNLIGPDVRLAKDMIPMFAVLLGNDYIERKVLAPFYSTISIGRANRATSKQYKRIKIILKWLQNHTIQSATRTILSHVRQERKRHVYRQILTAMRGYNCEDCVSFRYFGFTDTVLEDEEIERHIQDVLESDDDDNDTDALAGENEFLDEEEEAEASINEEEEGSDDSGTEPEEEIDSCDNENEVENIEDRQANAQQSSATDEQDTNDEDLKRMVSFRNKYTDHGWPEWFRELYGGAKVPRFLADLLHSNVYIHYPQVEDITKPDSNTISYPILRTIFALLKSSCSRPVDAFKYVSRRVKVPGLLYVTFKDVKLPDGVRFDPASASNIGVLEELFKDSKIDAWHDLFQSILILPDNLQLYFLIIIYWATNCKDANVAHVLALIVCILQLQIIDPSLKSKNRDVKLFQTQHKAYLEEQRKALKMVKVGKSKEDDQTEEFNRKFYNQLSSTTSRSELMLAYELLIGHFTPNEKLNRKHTSIDREIVHTLAEFQSVCHHFSALVPLLGYPFANIRMHELYNSMFVYNLYDTMKSRANPIEYACTTFFRSSAKLQSALQRMCKFVEKYVPDLQERRRTVRGKAKVAGKKKTTVVDSKPVKQKSTPTRKPGKPDPVGQESTSESDNDGFIDMNNKFSQLLLAS